MPQASSLPPLPLEHSSPPSIKQGDKMVRLIKNQQSVAKFLTKIIKRHGSDLFIISGGMVNPNFACQSCQETSVSFKYCLRCILIERLESKYMDEKFN